MKDFINILKRFLPPYKGDLIMMFVYNLLGAIFGVFSFGAMVPILDTFFNTSEELAVLEKTPWAFSTEAVMHNFNYYISFVKTEYGAEYSLFFIAAIALCLVFLKVTFAFLGSYHSVNIRNGVVRDMRQKIYAKLVSLPLPFFSKEKKGDIIARSTGDVQEVENSIMSSVDMYFKNPVLILVYLTGLLIVSVQLTLFVFIMLPIAGYIIGKTGKSLKKSSRDGQNKMGDILSTIEESLSGLRIIKAFNAEEKMTTRFANESNSYRRIMNSIMRRYVLAHPVSELLGSVVMLVIMCYGGILIINGTGDLTGSTFIMYLGMFYSIINPAKAFSKAAYSIQKGLAAMDRIDQLLDAESSIVNKENAKEISTFGSNIEYKNVSFSYDGERDVLKNVNVSIPKGKTVALVGQSGSGKTTFADLLPRFYDVKSGGIFIDGENIRDYKIADLRNIMGNVNQESILFNDTIFNNIAFGVETASMEEVITAAKIANAHEFITQTEHGYDTNIGDRGGKLSGGQRQRISIARAVLKNPAILILDEATSALDTESERLVQDALEKLLQNRTSLVIAHRLSTVKNADEICVFNEGEIVERGKHKELIEKDGAYKKLYDMQML